MDENKKFIENLTQKTGISLEEFQIKFATCKDMKHSEIRKEFMEAFNLTYGFANTLVHILKGSDGQSLAEGKSMDQVLDDIYTGKKASFRPVHDLIMDRIKDIGDFEQLPKKGYISLKHNKQFAMIGPKTNSRMEIGLNLKQVQADERLLAQPKGSMCKFIVKITDIKDVDDQLIEWIKTAYEDC